MTAPEMIQQKHFQEIIDVLINYGVSYHSIRKDNQITDLMIDVETVIPDGAKVELLKIRARYETGQ